MNMTEKNGQPSMEEILASIRRIIAEEPTGHHGELRGTPIMLKGDGVLDDAGDFDLPAIFRSSPPAAGTERQTPLLGRLTDALRGATTAQPETRGLFNGDDDYSRSQPVDGGSLSAEVPGPNAGLSSLRTRPSEAVVSEPHVNGGAVGAPASRESQSAPAALAASSGGSSGADAPKRVMSPFKDTHFLRMADPTGVVATPLPAPTSPASPVQAAPQPETNAPAGTPVDFRAIIPGQLDRTALVSSPTPAAPTPAPQTYAVQEIREEPYVSIPTSAAPAVGAMPPPPPLPSSVAAPAGAVPAVEETGTIEDTTADLLRPMLRQWLADNMPRMVEKALHIEIAESVKAPKKP
jgi:cell pole-organizing protein PopZ